MQYRTIAISDIHLGTKMCQAEALLDFLRQHESDHLYLVGDIIDGWALGNRLFWPQTHNDVIQKLLRKARKGTKITYLPGNHDEFLREFGDHDLGNISLVDSCTHHSANGLRYRVMHGDQFDVVIKHARWLAHIGSWAYDALIAINVFVSMIRRRLRLRPWSLSAWAKYKVKSAVNFIGDYEQNLAAYAQSHGIDGIICGHIHHANLRDIGSVRYLNCGDWVESCTALVEHYDGTWEILRHAHLPGD